MIEHFPVSDVSTVGAIRFWRAIVGRIYFIMLRIASASGKIINLWRVVLDIYH
jgi:hypothetical protein